MECTHRSVNFLHFDVQLCRHLLRRLLMLLLSELVFYNCAFTFVFLSHFGVISNRTSSVIFFDLFYYHL